MLQVEQSQSARKTPHQIIDQDYKLRYVKPLSAQEQQRQLQDQLRKQFQVQLIQRQDLLKRLKEVVIDSKTPIIKDQVEPGPLVLPTNSSIPIYLANGPKFQVIPQSNKNVPFSIPKGYEIKSVEVPTSTLSKGTSRSTSSPPKAIFDDLTKGVLPPGTNYEVIHQKQDGGLEEVGKLPQNLPEKKVTFVFLEEQPDGTVKVQGVRGNGEEGDKVKPSGAEVESILKKLKEGDLKLPPSTKLSSSPSDASSFLGTSQQESINSPSYISQTPRNSVLSSTTPSPTFASLPSASQNSPIPYLGFGNNGFPPSHTHFAQTTNMDFLPSVTAATPSQGIFSSFSSTPSVNTFPAQAPTLATSNSPYSVNVDSSDQSSPPDFQQGIPSYDEQNLGQNTRSAYPQQPVQVNNQQTFPPPQPPLSPQYQNIYNSFQQFSPTPPPAVQYSATTNNPDTFPNKQYFSPSGVSVQNNNQNSQLQFLPTIPTNEISSISQYPNLSSSSTPSRYQPPIIPFNPPVISSTSSNNGIDEGEFDSQRYVNTVRDNISTQKPKNNPKNRFRVARPQKEDEPIPELEEEDVKVDTRPSVRPLVSLTQTLKQQGLYAMARYLRESGLDNILNDTGPYTVFVPTDKAFRALLVQLGGPEMADEKFRENPRLLSGLLLHHVIPGAFRLDTLQDEMTGVSLAGTQLRVNAYNTQDVEWNDVQVVTINGARVSRAKHDLVIPQGIAHAIDRVMFPLPVGNVLQTLQSDREHRFNQFLRVVHSANLEGVLSGSKMHTVFAPTDKALNTLTSEDLEKIISDQVLSRALVHRHVSPGTLYSAGMRFYQIRDSLERGQQITINKSAGQVKVNNAHVVTHNIPATNGVIHAVDGLI
uniref:FAS1 domain-containing protein n=1 Tax=Timema douglasi TaxID=61478 RepID=A0A7R8VVT5_TIMDO|nr:unnamed protein product [Timema douglasi]